MDNVSLGKKRFMQIVSALVAFQIALALVPASATALTAQPIKILPPGQGSGCSAITFSEVTPHIYNGNLDSLDITVSDARYVAISTEVNHLPIAYHYVTRWNNQDGSVRMHVDLPSTRISHDVPVTAIFLASTSDTNGSPITCAIDFASTIPAPQGHHDNTNTHRVPIYIPVIKPVTGTGASTPGNGSHATSSVNISKKEGSVTKAAGLVAVTSSLGKLCTNGGSARLWVVLLVLYAVFVITLLMQKVEPGDLGNEWNVALILAIFLALLVFWYVSSVCRSGPWAPAIATLIAVAGLIYCMLQDETEKGLLLLKEQNK